MLRSVLHGSDKGGSLKCTRAEIVLTLPLQQSGPARLRQATRPEMQIERSQGTHAVWWLSCNG